MIPDMALFLGLAAVAVLTAIAMIASRNAIYSVLFLVLNFLTVATLYLLLNAAFIAMVQVTVYAGAIMVLFLFVLMLLDLKKDEGNRKSRRPMQIVGSVIAGILVVELGIMLRAGASAMPDAASGPVGSTKAIGQLLFTQYLFPFEVASVLLLSAIIGAVILAKRKLG